MALYYPPTANGLTKSLGAQLDEGEVSSVTLNNTTSIQNKAGVFVVDRVDTAGTEKAAALREYISFTAVSGSTLTGLTRGLGGGGADQDHAVGAVVEFVSDVVQQDGILDALDNLVTAAGALDTTKVVDLTTAQTLTNKTLTSPKINENVALTATATELNLLDGATSLGILSTTQYAPQGFLINGKIVPSVASNNLTVAIKGMDGNDPSASNPVYCRIGDTVRTITSALSVTKNAGTNYFNAGAAETAAQAIDYFVYLGYNATDGVVVGFSRIPFATQYDDFNSTATNAKYCAISTITTAAASDAYENIGRFSATLSAGAGYTWTVPTFTTSNLIQHPIYETRDLTWVSVWTSSGTAPSIGDGSLTGKYKIVGRRIHIQFNFTDGASTNEGTGNYTFTLPWTEEWNGARRTYPAQVHDQGVDDYLTSVVVIAGAANLSYLKDLPGATGLASLETISQTNPITWGSGDWLVAWIDFDISYTG